MIPSPSLRRLMHPVKSSRHSGERHATQLWNSGPIVPREPGETCRSNLFRALRNFAGRYDHVLGRHERRSDLVAIFQIEPSERTALFV